MQDENKKEKQNVFDLSAIQEDLSIKPVSSPESANSIEPISLDEEKAVAKQREKEFFRKRRRSVFALKLKALEEKSEVKSKRIWKEIKPVIKDETKKSRMFMFKAGTINSFPALIAKNIVFMAVALMIFAATVYFDSSVLLAQKGDEAPMLSAIIPANQVATILTESGEIRTPGSYEVMSGQEIASDEAIDVKILFPDYGELRLDINTNLVLKEIDTVNDKYEFILKNGSIWGNLQFTDYDVVIFTEYGKVTPGNASFSISYDGVKTDIYVDKHDIKVDVLNDDEILNTFWIAEGNKVQMLNSKIKKESETIKKLLYSKLIKEFNYGRISISKLTDDLWIKLQRENDLDYIEKVNDDMSDVLKKYGLKTLSTTSIRFQFKAMVTDLRSSLTFSEDKNNTILLSSIFENLHDAKYLYLNENDTDGGVRLALFENDIAKPEYQGSNSFQKELFAKLQSEFDELRFVVPGDNLYPVKNVIWTQLLSVQSQKFLTMQYEFDLLTAKINDVYDSIVLEPKEALIVFEEYFDAYGKIRLSYQKDLSMIEDKLIHQNILVSNLLFKSPDLYRVDLFESKIQLENDYIVAISGGKNKQEQRQTFITEKIDLLSRIKYFLFNEELDAGDARKIVFSLIRNIEDLKENISEVAAINQLFEKRLADFGVFWQYLNSPEYSQTPLHGASHKDRYDEFKKIQEDLVTFDDIREEILGSEEGLDFTTDDILSQVELDLKEAGVSNIEFGFYNDPSQTKVPLVKAIVAGITWRGTYDFDRKMVANIIVEDQVLTQEGVKLSNLQKFITNAVQEKRKEEEAAELAAAEAEVEKPEVVLEDPKSVDPDPIIENPVEDLKEEISSEISDEIPEDSKAISSSTISVDLAAKVFLMEKFSKLGMVVSRDAIEVKDLNAGEYEIKNVYYEENRNAKFSFSYSSSDDEVYNLVVETEQGAKVANDTFSSFFLKPFVLKIYEEAKL